MNLEIQLTKCKKNKIQVQNNLDKQNYFNKYSNPLKINKFNNNISKKINNLNKNNNNNCKMFNLYKFNNLIKKNNKMIIVIIII